MGTATGVSTSFCSQCGQPTAPENLVVLWGQPVCAACKPVLVRRMQEGNAAAAPVHYKGFWIRFAAKLLDGLVVGVVTMPLLFAMLVPQMRALVAAQGQPPSPSEISSLMSVYLRFYGIILALSITYYVWLHGKFGATLGKMAIGAKVVNADGSPFGYGKAFGRFFAEMLSGLILYIGYIIAGFDSQKRALHDHICGTRVVAK